MFFYVFNSASYPFCDVLVPLHLSKQIDSKNNHRARNLVSLLRGHRADCFVNRTEHNLPKV